MLDDSLDYLIEDDILQNFDYHHTNFTPYFTTPEKNLMMSVLLYGVMDFLSKRKDAIEWFESEDDHFYSWNNICLTLGFNKDKLRTRVLNLKTKPGRMRRIKNSYSSQKELKDN